MANSQFGESSPYLSQVQTNADGGGAFTAAVVPVRPGALFIHSLVVVVTEAADTVLYVYIRDQLSSDNILAPVVLPAGDGITPKAHDILALLPASLLPGIGLPSYWGIVFTAFDGFTTGNGIDATAVGGYI